MEVSTLIYLASIAEQVQFACVTVALFGSIAIHRASEGDRFLWFIHIPAWVVIAMATMFATLIPGETDIYKIAGVTSQQKAAIDATGSVIQEQMK